MIVLTGEEFNYMKKDVLERLKRVEKNSNLLNNAVNEEGNSISNRDLYSSPIGEGIRQLCEDLTKLSFYACHLDTEYECSNLYRSLGRLERANILDISQLNAFEKFEYLELLADMENYMTIADFITYWRRNLNELGKFIETIKYRLQYNLENTDEWLQLI